MQSTMELISQARNQPQEKYRKFKTIHFETDSLTAKITKTFYVFFYYENFNINM